MPVVFEINHPLLRRRVEREITRFFLRLASQGLLAPGRGRGAFEVRCLQHPPPPDVSLRPAEDAGATYGGESIAELECGGVRVRVRYRLAEPYGSALAGGGTGAETG